MDMLNGRLHPPVGCSLMTDEIVIVPEWHEGVMAEVGSRYSSSDSKLEWFQCGYVGGGVRNGGCVHHRLVTNLWVYIYIYIWVNYTYLP